MRFLKKISVLSILFFLHICSVAQFLAKLAPQNFKMVNWNMEEGFPHKYTRSMLKDKDGFLWIGTQTGLSRFDGSTFKNYFPGINKMSNVPSGTIQGITQDSIHNIWIGSDNGLWRYDNHADTFTHFLAANISANANTYIIPFWATSRELLCVEGDSIITAYNVHTLVKRTVVYLSKKILDNRALQFSVYEAGTNSVWMLLGMDGFFHVSLNNGRMESYYCNGTEGMCYDRKRNAIWMNTPQGLIRFNIASRQFRQINDADKFFERGVGISIDLYGRIWVGTGKKGIFIYDPDSRSVIVPYSRDSVMRDSLSWANYRIYCDGDGMVWVGYYTQAGKGITQLIPFTPIVQRYHYSNSSRPELLNQLSARPYSCIKANDGQLWFGADNKMNILNPNTGVVSSVTSQQLSGIVQSKNDWFVGIDRSLQKAWLFSGIHPKLYEADLTTLSCKPIILKDTAEKLLPDIFPDDLGIRQFKNGFIFLEGENNHNVFMLQKDSLVCHQLVDLGNKKVINLATDGEKALFVRVDGAPLNQSYFFLNGRCIRQPTPVDSIPWIEIRHNDADGTWWVGAFMQIAHYDKNFRLIQRYTQTDGVPDISVYSMMPDNKGDIWFNGSSGFISRLNTTTGLITTLSDKDGYQKHPYYPISSVQKDEGGNIYFLGYEEIDRVSPDKYVFVPSKIYLKALEIKEFSLPLSTGVNNLQNLSLSYFQNRINIETGVIDYYSKGQGHIRYKIEGQEKNTDWQFAPANYTIRYEELPPGKYNLFIQAGNAGNEFNGPIKNLLIYISPPFWNTWWFRVSVAIFIFAIFYISMRWRLKEKFRLQLERSEKETQIAEIKQKATELEMQALRAQMNPHFIFNSLNSINRFILQNNKAQASEYLTKFSKLVRLILQNSQASLITLESELESLELYLNLEALRFNYHFDYKISVPKNIDIEVLKVPPLILQPYVENAIWHGLMHKEEKGQLDVIITEEDDYLYFRIADNGVGRKQAAAMASKSATKHKSMGLRITAHRIAMLQKNEPLESPVTISDLVNADGTAAGTEVLIKMPVLYD